MTKRPALEPIPWLLFSAGGVVAALFLPVLVLAFAVVFPLGWVDPPEHQALHDLVRHPLTIVVLLGVFGLSLFHWAHRFRYTLCDGLKLQRLALPIGILCYGGALAGTVLTVWVLLQAR